MGFYAAGYVAAAKAAAADPSNAAQPDPQQAPLFAQQPANAGGAAAGPRVPPPANLDEAMARIARIASQLDFPVAALMDLSSTISSGAGDASDVSKLASDASTLEWQASMGANKTHNPDYVELQKLLNSVHLIAKNMVVDQSTSNEPNLVQEAPAATGPRTPPPTNLDEAITRVAILANRLQIPIGVLSNKHQKVVENGANPQNLKELHDMARNLRSRAEQEYKEKGGVEFEQLASLARAVQFFSQSNDPKLMV